MFDIELANLQNILSILSYFKKISQLQFLTAERDSMLFRKLMSEYKESKRIEKVSASHSASAIISLQDANQLNQLKKKIVNFIHREGETLNLDVFGQFNTVSRRTLKRHLSDLIGLGYIDREAQGKKVYYKKPLNRIIPSLKDAQS